MAKINKNDVDYIHVEDITFSVVMKDGSDVLVREKGISLEEASLEQLADNVMAHIEQGLILELAVNEDIIFVPENILKGVKH